MTEEVVRKTNGEPVYSNPAKGWWIVNTRNKVWYGRVVGGPESGGGHGFATILHARALIAWSGVSGLAELAAYGVPHSQRMYFKASPEVSETVVYDVIEMYQVTEAAKEELDRLPECRGEKGGKK